MFKKAHRSQSKLRLALIGPSGSGKTYSALLIAQGLGSKIALMDTERGSGSLYADLCEFDVADLQPPFTPERYIQAIKEASSADYEVLIIDSLSHAWAGEGGILDYVDKATQSLKNNFSAWREASPKHSSLVDSILAAPMHVIVTMRSKTAWEVQKDEKTGKNRPVKVGLAPVQRDGLEYEFTSVLELSVDGHVCTASKDRTGLFDQQYFVPSTKTGQTLREWLGENNQKREPEQASLQASENVTVIELFNTLRELGLGDRLEAYEGYLLHKYGKRSKDLSQDQVQEQLTNLRRCFKDGHLKQKFTNYLREIKEAA